MAFNLIGRLNQSLCSLDLIGCKHCFDGTLKEDHSRLMFVKNNYIILSLISKYFLKVDYGVL